MFKRIPKIVIDNKLYGPLLDVLDDTFMTAQELAARWRYSDDHLSNLRRAGKGPRFVKFTDTGGVRYYASDVITAELRGTAGKLSLADVELAVSACGTVPEQHRGAMVEHLRKALGGRS